MGKVYLLLNSGSDSIRLIRAQFDQLFGEFIPVDSVGILEMAVGVTIPLLVL
jgi:hypothetical protein